MGLINLTLKIRNIRLEMRIGNNMGTQPDLDQIHRSRY